MSEDIINEDNINETMREDMKEGYDCNDQDPSSPPAGWPILDKDKTCKNRRTLGKIELNSSPGFGTLPENLSAKPIDSSITGGHPMFHELLNQMREIHNVKNADYGDGRQLGNFMESEGFGVDAFRGILVRMSDKYSRIKSLAKRDNYIGSVKDESIEDTLIDLANYSLLAIVIRRENLNNKNKSNLSP